MLLLVMILWFCPLFDVCRANNDNDTGNRNDRVHEADSGEINREPQVRPRVALTFDDGPSFKYTPVLLDGLKERGVKATFFIIGENGDTEEGRRLIRRMKDEGHLIGNHTYHHVDLSSSAESKVREEISMTDRVICESAGKIPDFIRPPYGASPQEQEYPDRLYVKWTVDSLDWKLKNTEQIVQKVVTETKEDDMILMHDCYETSVEAALRIVDIFLEKGYEFVTADQLIIE